MNEEILKALVEWYAKKGGHLLCRLDFALEVAEWSTQRQKEKDAAILLEMAESADDTGYCPNYEVLSNAAEAIRNQE